MAKNLKINIKNTQIAEAIKLGSLKDKLAKKKADSTAEVKSEVSPTQAKAGREGADSKKEAKEEVGPKIKARSKSVFSEPGQEPKAKIIEDEEEEAVSANPSVAEEAELVKRGKSRTGTKRTNEELRREIFGDLETPAPVTPPTIEVEAPAPAIVEAAPAAEAVTPPAVAEPIVEKAPEEKTVEPVTPPPQRAREARHPVQPLLRMPQRQTAPVYQPTEQKVKLGPTGKHIKDLLPPKPQPRPQQPVGQGQARPAARAAEEPKEGDDKNKAGKPKPKGKPVTGVVEETDAKKSQKFKEYRDVKTVKKQEPARTFDVRDRQGLREDEDDRGWRKRRSKGFQRVQEENVVRPTSLKVRIPIAIKDLAAEMKLKASQLIAKLFLQGLIVTLNDQLEDETTIQLLGQEFGCEIAIDTSEEERIRVTDKTIKEEVSAASEDSRSLRAPIVAFMGHVDHGKTSLIDAIRKSNRAAGEAGAITQHIGAFRCTTPVGDIAILDTPGHEAFSAMRARGADVTDIVVLVVAGDEGIRAQTVEAIQHAKEAKVTIVVAINKSDKPNFNTELVYRQLADQELLPEAWGGQTITVNCSAVTGEGIQTLLEMLALQAEVLELNATPKSRARGSVLESEMHKGMGAVATVLVLNGTLNRGDALVFAQHWGRVKTMRDEHGKDLEHAGPSTPVSITGLSGLPEAGQEFIVVKNEKEAREIAEARQQGLRQVSLQQKKKVTLDNLLQAQTDGVKKSLNVIIRADVQGSLEALKTALMKIESTKAELNIIFAGVGEIAESDVQLAATSKALIVGFHTQIESHAEAFVKQFGIQVILHDIIYHAVDEVRDIMRGMLDKIAKEVEKGVATVKAVFKSSSIGMIAGCQVAEGTIHRNNHVRVKRNNELVWKGQIASLKRVKEDVREVQKGLECGIVLNGFTEVQEGDTLEAYEITYITQEL